MKHETQPLRMLIIDDHADDRTHLLHSLRQGFPGAALHEITSKQALDAALTQHPFDVVVAEYRLQMYSKSSQARATCCCDAYRGIEYQAHTFRKLRM